MHIHILGVCGTFMGGVAALARAQGHDVTGSDQNVYPPMSTQLEALGIEVARGYCPDHLRPAPDCVVVGNIMSRGNPAVEYMLDLGLPYRSGPQWLAEEVLASRWVIAVAGTHGKTTTASMLAWILEEAGCEPGFLIGGVPRNFELSARLGSGPFVVEADEYDSAFFDKRSKFVHYRPRTLAITNLEYDHADIFPDLHAIQVQFHHLLRTVPREGKILVNAVSPAIDEMLAMGCWTPVERFTADPQAQAEWKAVPCSDAATQFGVQRDTRRLADVSWRVPGQHNRENALAALAAAEHAGVPVSRAAHALSSFAGVKRRLEARGSVGGVNIYDDFAHHPTEVSATMAAMRERVGSARLVAVLEPRSNTMKMGIHAQTLGPALAAADRIYLLRPSELSWSLDAVAAALNGAGYVASSVDQLLARLAADLERGDHVVLMSNGDFGGLREKLEQALSER